MELNDDGNLAGWHRDPSGRHELRFWDGDRWTEHVIDEGIPGLDFPTRSGRAPGGVTATAPPARPVEAGTEEPEPAVDEPVIEVPAIAESVAIDEPPDTVEEPVIDLSAEADADSEPLSEPLIEPLSEPLVASGASVREAEPARSGGRSLRSRRRADPPVEPVAARVDAPEPTSAPEPVSEPAAAPIAAPAEPPPPLFAASEDPVDLRAVPVAPTAAESTVKRVSEPVPPTRFSETPVPKPPIADSGPRVLAEPPTVASPAGNSAGSNTSAIADPHRGAFTPNATAGGGPSAATGPRVGGMSPIPVKRYRPGSPPASPLAGPRALPGYTAPIGFGGEIVEPWYRKTRSWIALLAVAAVVALAVIGITSLTGNDSGSARLGGRPPAAAPNGYKVIDGDGFGIAAPNRWIVATDPGNTFPQLRHTSWGTPLAATDTAGGEAVVVVPLHRLAHAPSVDPDLFWSDQVRSAGPTRTITPLAIHGFRGTEISATNPSGPAMVAASVDTGDRTFLVAVTARTPAQAQHRFDALIQTFDAR